MHKIGYVFLYCLLFNNVFFLGTLTGSLQSVTHNQVLKQRAGSYISCHDNYISRKLFFGNPEKSEPRISPDGTHISYLANGRTPETAHVNNIWIQALDTGKQRQVTFETSGGIHNYFWRYNSKEILYFQDQDGDENWQLFGVSLSNGMTKAYTPVGSYAYVVAYSKLHPERILIALNDNNPALHDVYNIDLNTAERTRVAQNRGDIDRWFADQDLRVRVAFAAGVSTYTLIVCSHGSWEPHIVYTYSQYRFLDCLGFNRSGTALYLQDCLRNDTTQLIAYDIKQRSRKVIFSCDEYDAPTEFLYNDETDRIEAVAVQKERLEWHVLDPDCEAMFATLKAAAPGDIAIISHSFDRSKWLVAYDRDVAPCTYYLYDAPLGTVQRLFSSQPELEQYRLAPIQPISFMSRDGMEIHGYITLPVDTRASEKLPLMLLVHGGPCARDVWGYNEKVQWLANRGYTVLQVNYRGSGGYGKKFLTACYGEWGRKMVYDLIDGLQWAIDNLNIDRSRIGIYGRSYGGYAALCALTMYPELFACGIDVVGISNLVTFMEAILPHWKVRRAWFEQMIGHPSYDRDLLIERSPLTHVANIRSPVLIAQGGNDPRVKPAEAEQIVAALQAQAIPHEYVFFANEGHVFKRSENKAAFFKRAEKFLAEHLGGQYREQ